ncbi:MAG: phage holin family protein [Bacillota bacterium]
MAEQATTRQQWWGVLIRFVVSAVVLMIVSWVSPGFVVKGGFVGALIAAAVIALLGYLVEVLLGERISPQGRGIVGFIVAAVVIYLAQFIIPGLLSVSIIGALIAAFVIGLIDAFVPTLLR